MVLAKKIFRFFIRFCLWFLGVSVAITLLYRFVPPPATPLMFIRLLEQACDDKREMRLTKDWTSIENISPWFVRAAITSEDQHFMLHSGFDFEAIEKARAYNEKHEGKKIRGASTISQQTAKNVFLWPARSYFRKGMEVYFTALIELLWSKERIMEVYLNIVETGDGIYGVQSASREYFSKDASKVTKEQAALIIACFPSPLRWSPAHPQNFLIRKKNWIVRHMSQMDEPPFLMKKSSK